MTPFEQVHERSGSRCEAMVRLPVPQPHNPGRVVWTRCFRAPVEVHHALTRSRGGLILDDHGECAHLLALCRMHHRMAHGPGGHDMGLMINGYVTTGADGVPVYQGQDERLRRYNAVDVSELRGEVPGDRTSKGL